jgi:lysozyme
MSAELDLAFPRVKDAEGYRMFPYRDTVGVATIGYGCALDTGWPEPFAAAVAKLQLEQAELEARDLPGYLNLSPLRRSVLIEMVFNLGLAHVLQFTHFLAALKSADYKTAAVEMLDSKWATQVGDRARRLARIMETGADA